MKITILGANSYIARNLTYALKKKEGISLFLFDMHRESADGESDYQCINILDPESVKTVDMCVDTIYMFVGKTGSANGFDDPVAFIQVNEVALLNVLNEYRRQNSEAKIVFPSTRLVYQGRKGTQKEDDEKEARTIYAANKLACERYLSMYHHAFGIRYVTARICVPYGTLIPAASSYGTAEFMLGKAEAGESITLYGDGSVRRTLTHIEDLTELLYCLGTNSMFENDVYNIGGENYSLREMAELISDSYQVGIEYIKWPELAQKIESGDTVFDDTKLQGILGGYQYRQFSSWIKDQGRRKVNDTGAGGK